MRYSVYQLRKHPGRAHLHAVTPPMPKQTVFDGQSKAATWTPLAVRWVGNDLQPAEVSTIFGPGAIVVSERARESLQMIWGDDTRAEFLPLDAEGTTLYIVNVLTIVDCLRPEKSRLQGERRTYEFNPAHFDGPLFKIPQDLAGPVLGLEDSRNVEASFRYQVEESDLRGLRFEPIWEGNDKRQLTDKKPAPAPPAAKIEAPGPPIVQECSLSRVALTWPVVTGVENYLVQWSQSPDRGFVMLGTTTAAGGSSATFIDDQPTAGTSYYRVVGFLDQTRHRSPPSPVVEVIVR